MIQGEISVVEFNSEKEEAITDFTSEIMERPNSGAKADAARVHAKETTSSRDPPAKADDVHTHVNRRELLLATLTRRHQRPAPCH